MLRVSKCGIQPVVKQKPKWFSVACTVAEKSTAAVRIPTNSAHHPRPMPCRTAITRKCVLS